jgi:hypothetical protein
MAASVHAGRGKDKVENSMWRDSGHHAQSVIPTPQFARNMELASISKPPCAPSPPPNSPPCSPAATSLTGMTPRQVNN